MSEAIKVERRASTQDISWFIDLHNQGQLNLSPPYQRRSVWVAKDRKFFLDTVFRGYPCPPVYLHKAFDENGKSVYAVVDGKQRLETIIRFYENKLSIPDDFGNERLNGKRWKDIKGDSDLVGQFMDYVFPVEFINLPFEKSSYVKDVFDRLNRNSKTLNEQELRHAKYSGWFIKFLEEEIGDDFWIKAKKTTKSRAARMKDIQFLSELAICTIKNDIRGFSQDEIDTCYALYDDLDEEFDYDNGFGFKEIDVTEFCDLFRSVKEQIRSFGDSNPQIYNFAKDNKDFYSLWSYLVKSKLDDDLPKLTLEKYTQFMTAVEDFKSQKDGEPSGDINSPAYKYHSSNLGANTERPNRLARFEAMKEFFTE